MSSHSLLYIFNSIDYLRIYVILIIAIYHINKFKYPSSIKSFGLDSPPNNLQGHSFPSLCKCKIWKTFSKTLWCGMMKPPGSSFFTARYISSVCGTSSIIFSWFDLMIQFRSLHSIFSTYHLTHILQNILWCPFCLSHLLPPHCYWRKLMCG